MSLVDSPEGLTTYEFDVLSQIAHVAHFVTTRSGGASRDSYRSLNLGYHVGDQVDRVAINRQRLCRSLRIPMDGLTVGRQVHGANVELIGAADRGRGREGDGTALDATDGLITNLTDTCLLVLVADCVPVLLCDRREPVVAAVHAGWRGTAAAIVSRTVELMVSRMGCRASDIHATLGPAIGAADYEVGDEVVSAMAGVLPDRWSEVVSASPHGGWLLDLLRANQMLLESSGVPSGQIELAPISTYSEEHLFFSARRDGIETGRFGAGIMLRGGA